MMNILWYFVVLSTTLLFSNNIKISVNIKVHANVRTKTIHVDNKTIKKNIYLENNYEGLTIALTDSSYHSSILFNNTVLNNKPINFANNVHSKLTKVAELIIFQQENRDSLCITIFAK